MGDLSFLQTVAVLALPFLMAVTFHEVAHGWVANLLGDPTAAEAGRLTLNPLRHIDPLGLLALLLTQMIGWAKPVPINPLRLRHPKEDMVWVALAGPAMNLLLAVASAVLLHTLQGVVSSVAHLGGSGLVRFLYWTFSLSLQINVALAVFNCLPLPPLDGGRILVGLLPMAAARWVARVEPYGFIILLVLLVSGIVPKLISPPIALLLHLLG
ncbi:MAG: site-2 protease family protein [Nitrospirae bacterium CG18_big_fil_WC_8_21_14_2_50_70_55]|nr:site-2 protease family protein [Deltaproteobacteria bacterium]OIP64952.1 MAG: hypothetical protein AUK30_05610 [Nitrospirae bacterium CG2_30_70_394]PIQ03894.1 MAG: site-2 protease family protein [Nitrospirae bacterium CG18_big_fil_WC_8_21_14_2_50_70_55]PIU79899.1 MAG: site-2 protease family protein [Nitrospirae bacterium CG06_land_8_20_14_3_00_70_43]PIW82802.1 MAG: site-2 protease family protein [Nitrospirae bacterium CG_4_8_14_3_um_filter_70_85]PIX84213.1 MAG: site-2 protease family protei